MTLLLALLLSQVPTEDGSTHLGAWKHSIHGLVQPGAVAIGPGGRIHVAEVGAGRVSIFDVDGNALGVLETVDPPLRAPEGIAVSPDGLRFVSDSGNHRVVIFDADGQFKGEFGGRGWRAGQFLRPLGIDAGEHRVLVADSGNQRVQSFDHAGKPLSSQPLHTLSSEQPEYRDTWPTDVALNPSGDGWALDSGSCGLIVLGQEGLVGPRHGEFGFFPGTFASPRGFAHHASRLYIADTENHRIQVFESRDFGHSLTTTLKPAYIWGVHANRPREGRGKLHYPRDVAVAPDGSFAAVAEPLDGRVQIFVRAAGSAPQVDAQRATTGQAAVHFGMELATDGPLLVIVEPETAQLLIHDLRRPEPERRNPPLLISKAGGRGLSLGHYRRPAGMDLDYDARRILVCDRGSRRVHELRFRHDPDGEIAQDFEMVSAVRMIDFRRPGATGETSFPWPVEPIAVQRTADGGMLVLDAANACVHRFDSRWAHQGSLGEYGSGLGQLNAPVDLELSVDETHLFVSDPGNGRLLRWSLADEAPTVVGEEQLRGPHGLAFGPDGRIWVSDAVTHQVWAFDSELNGQWVFGEEGLARGGLLAPRGLAFTDTGECIIMDHGNHRGIVLDSQGNFLDAFGPRSYTRPALRPERYREEDYDE